MMREEVHIKILFTSAEERNYSARNGKVKVVSSGSGCDLLCITQEGGLGSSECVLSVKSRKSFSFLVGSVNAVTPIYSKRLGIAVTTAEDDRSFAQIEEFVRGLGGQTQTERIEAEEEFSYEKACKLPERKCTTFLAAPGNVNIWEMGFRGFPIEEKQHFDLYDYIVPRQNWDRMDFDEDAPRVTYRYMLGRGMAFDSNFQRRNEEGYLPILHADLVENEIHYAVVAFCDSKAERFDEEEGSNFLTADLHSAAHVLSEEQQKIAQEGKNGTDTLLRVEFSAENRSKTSKIAYFRFPHINTPVMAESCKLAQKFEGGVGYYKNKVFCRFISSRGVPTAQECAFILAPNEKISFQGVLFHSPVSVEESKGYDPLDFADRKAAVKAYWEASLGTLKDWRLPERQIDEGLKTGYIHLTESCYGKRGEDILAPAVGVYSPIGSESSPVIRFLDAVGKNEQAEKCLNYFFSKQRADGFIQNMVGYMLENGACLYTAGRHFALTDNKPWVLAQREKIILAAEYLIAWIERNKTEEKNGYGMIDGQVADPVDLYRSFSLNALCYAGLKATADMMTAIEDDFATRAQAYAMELRANIKAAYATCEEVCPLVPIGNGEWIPAVGPWAEALGDTSLHLDGEICVTHSSHILKDSLLSLPFLVYYDIFDLTERESCDIIEHISDCFLDEKTGYSQPYYSLIPFIDLMKGNKKSFLKEYYTAFATLADRNTYSFWEHYFLATPHKTHEQAWFLLRTLYMLYYCKDGRLCLLYGIPESWIEDGKEIVLKDAVCDFGKFSLCVKFVDGKYDVCLESDFKEIDVYIKLATQELKIPASGKLLGYKK